MKLNKEQVAKYVKAAGIILPVIGIQLEPEYIEAAILTAGLIYSGISVLEAHLFKKDK